MQRPGAVKGAAFRARRERTLDGEDRCERIGEGGKDLVVKWGKVLHDEDLAAAILDRVLERGRFIHLDGPSGRTRHLNLEEVLPAESERVRISGTNGSEFQEPITPLPRIT